MTEDEHIRLVDVGDSFWRELGLLAAKHIAMMPEEIEHEVTMYLQDRCSIYGSPYSEPLAKLREEKE
jgi:hypothetical protein